jgi:hypothetical protein
MSFYTVTNQNGSSCPGMIVLIKVIINQGGHSEPIGGQVGGAWGVMAVLPWQE